MALTKKSKRTAHLDDEGGLGEWYADHATAINWILAVVLVAVVAWRGYDWYRQTQIQSANAAFGTVQQKYQTAMAEGELEKRRAALSEVVPQLETVSRDHAGTPLGDDAQLMIGNALFYLASGKGGQEATEDFKRAQQAYEKYVSTANSSRDRAAGQLALGNTLENLLFLTKDLNYAKEALEAYKQAESLAPETYIAAESRIAQARIHQAQGRQDEARKLYETVAEERKLPALAAAEDTTLTTQQGQEISPEEIARLRSFEKNTYENVAKTAAERLRGLPTAPQQ